MLKGLLPEWVVRSIWPENPPRSGGDAPGDVFLQDNIPKDTNILAEIAKDPLHAIQILLRVGEPHIYITYDDDPEEHLVLALSTTRHLMPDYSPGQRSQRKPWYEHPKVLTRGKDNNPHSTVTMREGPALTIHLSKATQAKLDAVTAKHPNVGNKVINKSIPPSTPLLNEFMQRLPKVGFHIPIKLLCHPNGTGHLCRMTHNPHLYNTDLVTRYGTFDQWPHQIYGGDMLPVHGVEFEFVGVLETILADMKRVIDSDNLTDARLLSVQGFAEKVKTLEPFSRGDIVRSRSGEYSRLDGVVVKPANSWFDQLIVVVPSDNSFKLIQGLSGNFELIMTKAQADKMTAGGRALLGGLTPVEFIDKYYPEPEFEI